MNHNSALSPRGALGLLACFAVCACNKEAPAGAAAASASAAVAPAPVAATPPPKEAGNSSASLAGNWTATLNAERYKIEMTRAEGAVNEWASDDGKIGVGQASLQLQVSPEGVVSGASDGALGKLDASGQASGEKLLASLNSAAKDAKAFSGTLLATRAGDVLKGHLQVSSGDSLLVRRAEVTLTKLGAGAAAPP